jgi:hypothetical protein
VATYELNENEEKWILEQRKRKREEAYEDVSSSEILSAASRILKFNSRDDRSCRGDLYSALVEGRPDSGFDDYHSLNRRCRDALWTAVGSVCREFKSENHQEFMACLKQIEDELCAK